MYDIRIKVILFNIFGYVVKTKAKEITKMPQITCWMSACLEENGISKNKLNSHSM